MIDCHPPYDSAALGVSITLPQPSEKAACLIFPELERVQEAQLKCFHHGKVTLARDRENMKEG